MTNEQLALMERQLVLHEGLKLRVYPDTLGNATILVGYNLEARGWDFINKTLGITVAPHDYYFTMADALRVLRADIERIEKIVIQTWPHYLKLDPVRQRVVIDMSFNIGRGVLNFKKAKAAMETGNWSACVRELYKSRWAVQVDDGEGGRFGRADRLASMVLVGQEPSDPAWLRFTQAYAA